MFYFEVLLDVDTFQVSQNQTESRYGVRSEGRAV